MSEYKSNVAKELTIQFIDKYGATSVEEAVTIFEKFYDAVHHVNEVSHSRKTGTIIRNEK